MVATIVTTEPGKWCLGHGVIGQAESLRNGHYVQGYLVKDNFSINNGEARGAKGLSPTLHPRCTHCESIRRWHDHHQNAYRRAHAFRRQHAERWVDKGRFTSVQDALTEMDIGGVTVHAIVALILAAIDQPCPGLCAHEDHGRIIFHTITRVADLHVDVKNPDEPFAIENIGILCNSCNPAKHGVPWAVFIYRRRAHIRAWQEAIDNRNFQRAEQLRLDGT